MERILVMPGFSHKKRAANAFKESLWPQFLQMDNKKDCSILEARCYEEEEPTVRPLKDYSHRLSIKIDRERPKAIVTADMGGLALIDAIGKLEKDGKPWSGKIVFINTPFRGATEWELWLCGFPTRNPPLKEVFQKHETLQELINSFPTRTPAMFDMDKESKFIKGLDFDILDECECLCLLGKFSKSRFGFAGMLTKSLTDPKDLFDNIIGRYNLYHDEMFLADPVGRSVVEFINAK